MQRDVVVSTNGRKRWLECAANPRRDGFENTEWAQIDHTNPGAITVWRHAESLDECDLLSNYTEFECGRRGGAEELTLDGVFRASRRVRSNSSVSWTRKSDCKRIHIRTTRKQTRHHRQSGDGAAGRYKRFHVVVVHLNIYLKIAIILTRPKLPPRRRSRLPRNTNLRGDDFVSRRRSVNQSDAISCQPPLLLPECPARLR